MLLKFKIVSLKERSPGYYAGRQFLAQDGFIYKILQYDANKKWYNRSTADGQTNSGFLYTHREIESRFERGVWTLLPQN